jgi:hypothetical protein
MVEVITEDENQDEEAQHRDMDHTLSLVAVLVAFGLMASGYLYSVLTMGTGGFPGPAVPLLSTAALQGRQSVGLLLINAGIVILGLLPLARVLLAAEGFMRHRQLLNMLLAMAVFTELLISVRI